MDIYSLLKTYYTTINIDAPNIIHQITSTVIKKRMQPIINYKSQLKA